MFRIGQGYDVHRLKEGREFWLGGVLLDSTFGPDGHSDADVLTHALCDALLGSLALGDIGRYFPNTDEKWRGARSLDLLAECVAKVHERGYVVVNVDASLSLEAPKVLARVPDMQAALAPVLGVTPDDVSIKATTGEGMGFVGRREGVMAMAIALIRKRGS